jgi:exopolysaccharide biosynthesis polyprenyl glycosylphosphotransferase
MPASRKRPLRALVLVLDAALVVGAMALAAGLHNALRGHVETLRVPPRFKEYALVVYLAVPLWLGLVSFFGLHRTFERTWTRAQLVFDLLKLHVVGFLGLLAAVFFTQSTINRSLVALFLGCSFLLSYAARSALGYWQRYQHRSGQARTRLLIVGDDSPELRELLKSAEHDPHPPLYVGQLGGATVDGLTPKGAVADLARVLHDEAIDHVLFFPPYHHATDAAPLIRECETVGVGAELAVELAKPSLARPRVADLYGMPFISFDAAPKSPERIAVKHAFDWLVAAVAIVVLLPLFLVVALAIVITMGRPVFFLQARAGLHGRPFRLIKFRTMVADAEARQSEVADKNEMTGPVFKVTNDPRVTRLGRFLRKSSIDELPQLINVLRGQMSLVGPRPLPIQEQQGIHGWQRKRLSMKPGITGIWQISGRSNIDFEEWMRLDQKYVDEWTLGLDLAILIRTLPVVVFGRGAR